MAVLAGIDEAGLGPVLGPMVLSATAFKVHDAAADLCLWRQLAPCVARSGQRDDRRLVIGDSKKLFAGRRSLAGLERGVLVMLASAGVAPRRWLELLDAVSPACLEHLRHYPWYDGADFPLPLDPETGDVATRANPVRRQAALSRIEFVAARSEVLIEGEYNRRVSATRNKSRVVLDAVLRLVDQVLGLTQDPQVRIVVDRLGGREHYREPLMTAFPGMCMHVLEESPQRSAYELSGPMCRLTLEFLVEAEEQFLPTALSSMFSKYLRELFMHAFNAYWLSHAPDLKPTAGYYTDAQRFLRDVAPVLARLNIDRSRLVRVR